MWVLSAHLQVKSEAQADDIKLPIDFFKYVQRSRYFVFGEVIHIGHHESYTQNPYFGGRLYNFQ